MWFVYALGSAVFAALTSILAKIGIPPVKMQARKVCGLSGLALS